jgi:competence CoiA-like predicted nuclease
MNLSLQAFGEHSDEQKVLIQRAVAIENEEHQLYEEKQQIYRKLKQQGISLWEEIRLIRSQRDK